MNTASQGGTMNALENAVREALQNGATAPEIKREVDAIAARVTDENAQRTYGSGNDVTTNLQRMLSEQGGGSTTGATATPTLTGTGRGSTGRLRNFKAMSDAKFDAAYSAVCRENNDPEALDAVQAEYERRNW